jgi:protein phosphatase PTC7
MHFASHHPAFFVSNDGRALGVADGTPIHFFSINQVQGVGGWADEGVDPSIYARSLMKCAQEAYEKNNKKEPMQILNEAWIKCKSIIGSSTACIVVLDAESKFIKFFFVFFSLSKYYRTANLGDSGVVIIRDNKVLFHSPQQQVEFNFPYQVLLH